MRRHTLQQPWGATTKDRIACVDLRSLSVCVELIIRMKGHALLVSRVVTFWLPVVRFNVLLESHALLLNARIMHASPLTQTRRFTARLPGHLVPRKQAIYSVVGQTLGE